VGSNLGKLSTFRRGLLRKGLPDGKGRRRMESTEDIRDENDWCRETISL
jgi:hypothetical protein